MIEYLIKKILLEEVQNQDNLELDEKWSEKYKKSINCNNPKGFSQRAHCQGRKKKELEEYARTLKMARRQGVGVRFPKSAIKNSPQRFRKYSRNLDESFIVKKIKRILKEEFQEKTKIYVSKDGLINFLNITEVNGKLQGKAYRYKLFAEYQIFGSEREEFLKIKFFDVVNGYITIINPKTNEEQTETVSKDIINKIKSEYKNEGNFKNIFSFEKMGTTVNLNLDFYEKTDIQI